MHSPFPAPIPADMLLLAYRNGIFPMADSRDDPEVFWVEPKQRAIFPLDQFHMSRSLKKAVAQDRFEVTIDSCFVDVMEACSQPRNDHPDSWISERIKTSYRQLHHEGHAHSVECWLDGELVGGLYGVSFDRVFCGESMFSRATDASKVALVWLVSLMRQSGYRLLDCQFMTEHLASMGAVEIEQSEYLERVAAAAGNAPMSLGDVYSKAQQSQTGHSPGKLIAQSLTQMS
ncbi:MAG: leucyl/phenylalanyl-tRNA--protein transferase [Erythrobacter sp.]